MTAHPSQLGRHRSWYVRVILHRQQGCALPLLMLQSCRYHWPCWNQTSAQYKNVLQAYTLEATCCRGLEEIRKTAAGSRASSCLMRAHKQMDLPMLLAAARLQRGLQSLASISVMLGSNSITHL